MNEVLFSFLNLVLLLACLGSAAYHGIALVGAWADYRAVRALLAANGLRILVAGALQTRVLNLLAVLALATVGLWLGVIAPSSPLTETRLLIRAGLLTALALLVASAAVAARTRRNLFWGRAGPDG